MTQTQNELKNVVIRLTNTKPGHSKYWGVRIKSRRVYVFWGHLGRLAKHRLYSFSTNVEAQDFVEQKVNSKLRKGYKTVRHSLDFWTYVERLQNAA